MPTTVYVECIIVSFVMCANDFISVLHFKKLYWIHLSDIQYHDVEACGMLGVKKLQTVL